MPRPEIHIFKTMEELSCAAAERFVETARARIEAAGEFFAALSGGSTPRRLFELLASSDHSSRIAWAKVQLFQVDERQVPPSHPESNFRMIRETLLAPVRLRRDNFHRMAGEQADAVEAARQYASHLASAIPQREGNYPRLDLVLLGMGNDGHTASLFPGSPALEEREHWVIPSTPGGNGLPRITLTYPVLNAAAMAVFLVSGCEKAVTLRRVIEGPSDLRTLPAQGILPVNGRVVWYVDEAAASQLHSGGRTNG
ncbi:MAG: 6-phosphogluconolactonase [Terriglobia bacterium]